MSYAEQHIFLANRPLTPAQSEHADSLSSHAVVGSNYAIYTYFYGGSFRGNEDELLSDTFDAMLWLDSTGSAHLRFRLSKKLVPKRALKPFIYPDDYPSIEVELKKVGKNTLLGIRTNKENGERVWLEDAPAPLQILMPVREDILAGDYRLLHLIWQHNNLVCDEEIETIASALPVPPAPPGMDQLPEHLIECCSLLGMDYEELLEKIPATQKRSLPDYDHKLNLLSKKRMLAYLQDLLNNEPNLAAKLRRELAEMDK